MRKSGFVKAKNTPQDSFLSSSLFLYGHDSTSKGSKKDTVKLNDDHQSSSNSDSANDDQSTKMATGINGRGKEEPKPLAHLNLTETQLNALSYSLSELAEKISPTKNEFVDEVEWELKTATEGSGIDRSSSLSRRTEPSNSRTKTPYTKSSKHGMKHPLSKQKSFNKGKQLLSNEFNDKSQFGSRVSHQESVESGYNSSWSSNSFNEDKYNADTDIEEESVFSDSNTDKYDAHALETKISDVEKRINSLIIGRRASELGKTDAKSPSEEKENASKTESTDSNNETTQNEDTDVKLSSEEKQTKTKPLENNESESNKDATQNGVAEVTASDENKNDIVKSPGNSLANGENELKKSPFQVHKVRKTSLDDITTKAQKPTRPGLVRRRTTLVTFRPPRKTSAFNEVDDSGVLEIDEAGFVQCLTDVRSMKTMLLKLKRELQEAEVQSPLSRSVSSRSISNMANSLSETTDEGSRRHTYDSSETIQKKLQRIRSKSMSRRKHSSCAESPLEDMSAADHINCTDLPEVSASSTDTNNEVVKMKEELDDLKQKMKGLQQERDSLFVDKEEIEHELEAKNHTIKMLQKQLEAQENSDEVTCLQRQVTALTQQVRQQQQKIAELKYQASPTRRDSVKLDIKNRLRDAFTRHLEESSKSHMLLSKHIEKAEFTVSEAQKGLKSLCITSSSEDDEPSSMKKRSATTSVPGSPRNSLSVGSEENSRRHSWTLNSIDKIIKTWKDTTQSIENIGKSPKTNKKSTSKPSQPSSPHLSFL